MVASNRLALEANLNAEIAVRSGTTIPRVAQNALAAVPSWGFGNSWMATNGAAPSSSVRGVNMIAADLRLRSFKNRATAGFRAQDCAVRGIGNPGPIAWRSGDRGIVFIDILLNNLIEPDSTANRRTALESVRALCAVIGAQYKIEQSDSSFTYSTSPAYGNAGVSGTQYSSGTSAFTSTNGSYVTINVNSGVNYLLLEGMATGGSNVGGIAHLYDATTGVFDSTTLLTSVDLSDAAVNTPFLVTNSTCPVVVQIPGTTARPIRVVFDTAGRGTGSNVYMFVDAILPQQTIPPLIVLVKPCPVLASDHQQPSLMAYLRTIPDLVKAEFGANIIVADPGDTTTGWDPNAMLGSDLLHMNTTGQYHYRDIIVAAVENYFTSAPVNTPASTTTQVDSTGVVPQIIKPTTATAVSPVSSTCIVPNAGAWWVTAYAKVDGTETNTATRTFLVQYQVTVTSLIAQTTIMTPTAKASTSTFGLGDITLSNPTNNGTLTASMAWTDGASHYVDWELTFRSIADL